MYKVLKNYREVENHKIKGKIILIERLEERSILINFYEQNLDSNVYNSKFNYFPLNQQHFNYKQFCKEKFLEIKSDKNTSNLKHVLIDQSVFLKLNNFKMNFGVKLIRKYFKQCIFKKSLKYFLKMRSFKKFIKNPKLLSIKFLYFLNKNIKYKIYKFLYGTTLYKNSLKFFKEYCIKNFVQLMYKKKRQHTLYLLSILKKVTFKKMFVQIIGLNTNFTISTKIFKNCYRKKKLKKFLLFLKRKFRFLTRFVNFKTIFNSKIKKIFSKANFYPHQILYSKKSSQIIIKKFPSFKKYKILNLKKTSKIIEKKLHYFRKHKYLKNFKPKVKKN